MEPAYPQMKLSPTFCEVRRYAARGALRAWWRANLTSRMSLLPFTATLQNRVQHRFQVEYRPVYIWSTGAVCFAQSGGPAYALSICTDIASYWSSASTSTTCLAFTIKSLSTCDHGSSSS